MAEARFYVYVHRQADTGEVFYVGKGSGKRAWQKSRRSPYWRNVFAKHGLIVEIVSADMTERLAFKHEMALIAAHRAVARKLANLTLGGEGATHTEEGRAKMSAAHKGKPLSESHRAALKGRVLSEEHMQALRASWEKPERKAKIAATMRGHVKSEEHRAALSRAAKEDWARRKAAKAAAPK